MKVVISTEFACSFEQVVEQVKKTKLLRYVAHPLVQFEPIDPPVFPNEWSGRTYWVNMKLFGLFPFGKQAIVISVFSNEDSFTMRDAGHSALIKVWDHRIKIFRGSTEVSYQDEIDIQAGLLTPVVWLFALFFYRHRQRRWRRLVARDFDYGDD